MFKCDACDTELSTICYKPSNSAYDVDVYQCPRCSLVQSIKMIDNPKKNKTVSCDADWGNVRHGKSLRFDILKTSFLNDLDFTRFKSCLDIGSNRGDFVNFAASLNPSMLIDAVEPDGSVIKNYNNGINIHNDRFENTNLSNKYDFIYSCQTLEHATSAKKMLADSVKLLSNEGMMLIDVPSVEIIQDKNIIEEFFIDKHSFHFDATSLEYLLNVSNLEIIKKDYNKYNLSVLVRKRNNSSEYLSDVNDIIPICKTYLKKRESNRKLLKKLVSLKIDPLLKKQKVGIWGASRTLDALIKYGDLDIEKVHVIVDSYLFDKIKVLGKIKIKEPSYLKQYEPSVVIVLARSAEDEISSLAYKMGVRHIIKYSEIFEQILIK